MILFASHMIYVSTLKRKDKDMWGRESAIEDPQQREMDALGQAWLAEHRQYEQDVHIVRDGLNLYGKYYDLGFKRCCMLLSGRTESLRYGYFFVKPYTEAGWNVMVFDARSHGNSDGQFNTLGFEESKDDIAWVKFLRDEYNMNTVIFHGICIGAAGGMYAITSDDCPDNVKGIVTEGMFANFGESMKNHLIERNKPVNPVYPMINLWMKHYTGHTMDIGPINCIHKLDKPILMIQSKEDNYSTPENAQKLFDKCPSKNKTISWHERGAHSMLRPTDTERYDNAIKKFIAENFDN